MDKMAKGRMDKTGGRVQKRTKSRWRVGDPLNREDQVMLAVVIRRAERLGFSPTQKEVTNAEALKKRFGNWTKVMTAAGLPPVNDPDQMRKRQAARDWQATMETLGVS